MKFSLLFGLCCSTTLAWAQQPELADVLDTITAEDCMANVEVLASPSMTGRATLSSGFLQAAEMVESQLKALGYEPANGDSYRISFSLNCVVAGEETHFVTAGIEQAKPWQLEKDFVPVIGSRERDARGEAVFVGYAIDAKKEHWVDLKKKDVRGKIVFAFTREPRADDIKARAFDGAKATRYSEVKMKADAVFAAGGLALVLVPDPGLVASEEQPLPSMVPFVDARGAGAVGLQRQMNFPDMPILSVSRAVAGTIFDTDLRAYHKTIDKKKKPKLLRTPKGMEIQLGVEWASADREAFNLGALLKGSEENGEYLVLGAHLDHVGFDVFRDQMRLTVRPGADDNASGSGALLEVAQALAGTQPQTNILFLWFAGEELGLLGSAAYCRDPLFPHEKTIAMLNMDMVGRGDKRKANVGGMWSRPNWEKFLKEQHKRIKSPLRMDYKQGRDLYARSDQYSFHQKGVVGLFFFEADLNSNKVYHQPGDVADTMNGEKMALIARLFTACAWALAYEGVRP